MQGKGPIICVFFLTFSDQCAWKHGQDVTSSWAVPAAVAWATISTCHCYNENQSLAQSSASYAPNSAAQVSKGIEVPVVPSVQISLRGNWYLFQKLLLRGGSQRRAKHDQRAKVVRKRHQVLGTKQATRSNVLFQRNTKLKMQFLNLLERRQSCHGVDTTQSYGLRASLVSLSCTVWISLIQRHFAARLYTNSKHCFDQFISSQFSYL